MSLSKSLVTALSFLWFMMLPNLSLASSGTDFSNHGGTLSGSNTGLSLSGSTLNAVSGLNSNSTITRDLGTLSFTTGALTTGSLQMGGTFAAGGTFTVDGNGTNGIPNGTLFSGTFSAPVTWTLATLANGTHNYTLTGVLTGSMGGKSVDGVSVQLTINTGRGFFNGSTLISGGDTIMSSEVPEPASLVLFGTGTLTLVGALRRKVLAR